MIKIQDNKERVCQGDVFKDIEYIEYAELKDGNIEISKIIFPLIIVLTQDCDLEQDSKFRSDQPDTQDKLLISVLVAPLYNEEHVFSGEQLSELNFKMQVMKSEKKHNIKLNETPRYHYINFPISCNIVPSVIDFKHYFSVNVNYLRTRVKSNYVCSVSPVFRENISHRFSFYLSRIGLPDIKPI